MLHIVVKLEDVADDDDDDDYVVLHLPVRLSVSLFPLKSVPFCLAFFVFCHSTRMKGSTTQKRTNLLVLQFMLVARKPRGAAIMKRKPCSRIWQSGGEARRNSKKKKMENHRQLNEFPSLPPSSIHSSILSFT